MDRRPQLVHRSRLRRLLGPRSSRRRPAPLFAAPHSPRLRLPEQGPPAVGFRSGTRECALWQRRRQPDAQAPSLLWSARRGTVQHARLFFLGSPIVFIDVFFVCSDVRMFLCSCVPSLSVFLFFAVLLFVGRRAWFFVFPLIPCPVSPSPPFSPPSSDPLPPSCPLLPLLLSGASPC